MKYLPIWDWSRLTDSSVLVLVVLTVLQTLISHIESFDAIVCGVTNVSDHIML